MNKVYLDNVLDNSVHFSKHSCAWKIILPMLLVDKFVLDKSDTLTERMGLQRSDTDVLIALFLITKYSRLPNYTKRCCFHQGE